MTKMLKTKIGKDVQYHIDGFGDAYTTETILYMPGNPNVEIFKELKDYKVKSK